MDKRIDALVNAVGGTIQVVEIGGNNTPWFGVRNKEWEDYIRAHPEKYPGVNPIEVYCRNVFNKFFTAVIRRKDPRGKIRSIPGAYSKVLQWLINNNQKGLFMVGDCGTGKTAIMIAIKEMLEQGYGMWKNDEKTLFESKPKIFRFYTAQELMDSRRLDEALTFRLVMVDDIGTESETLLSYGNRRNPIAELVDNAERKDCLMVLTSNLTNKQLFDKYGERTMDRIKHLCKCVSFEGASFR